MASEKGSSKNVLKKATPQSPEGVRDTRQTNEDKTGAYAKNDVKR